MPENDNRIVSADREMLSINLKWFHLALVVIGSVLTLAITVATLTNRYVDSRIRYHMGVHEQAMRIEVSNMYDKVQAQFDERVEKENLERKETMKDLRSDVNYIRDKVDDIYARMPRR